MKHSCSTSNGVEFPETFYRELFENSADAMLLIEDGRFVECNQAALDMLRMQSKADVLNMSPADISPELQLDGRSSTEKAAELLTIAIAQGGHRFEWLHRAADGETFSVEVLLVPITLADRTIIHTIWRDITERKQTEQQIQESQRQLSILMGNLPGMAYRMLNQPDWPAEFISQGSAELTGYLPKALQIGGTLAYGDLIHPEDQEMVWDAVQVALAEQQPFQLTYRIHSKAGDLKWVGERGQGIYDASGTVIAREGFITDITKRKQAEASLLRSVSLLQTTLESIDDGILVVNQEGKVINSNPAFAKIWHIPDALIAARDDESLLSHVTAQVSNPEQFLSKVRELYAQPEANSLDILYLKDGRILERYSRPFWVEDKVVGRMWNFRDTTEFKQANAERERLLIELNRLLNNVGDAIVATDLEGVILSYNPAAEQMYGWTAEEARGKNVAILYKDADLPILVEQIIQPTLENGLQKGEYHFVRKSGESRIEQLTTTTVLNDEGEVIGMVGIASDITERKQAEREIQASEERFRSVVEYAQSGILILDDAYHFVYVNDELCRITGYERTELLGMDFRKVLTEESVQLVADRYVRRQRGEEIPSRYEFTIARKDGVKRDCEISSTAFKDSDGNARSVGQLLDITERKQAEQAVRESAAQARESAAQTSALLAAIPDMMFRLSAEGTFLDFKAESESDLAVPPEAFLGKKVDAVLPPELAELTLANLRKVIETGAPSVYEYQLVPMGEQIPHHYEARMVTSGTGVVLALIRDITERKQAQAELERMGLAIEQAGDGIAIADLAGNVQFVNPAWAEMHGYSAEELLGQPLSMFHTEEQLREEVLPFNARAMASGSSRGEVGHVAKDGRIFPTLMTSTVIRDEAGKPVGLMGTIRDITDRKRAEAERERLLLQLGTAAEIAAELSAILDPNTLFETLVQLTKERFGFYHVHFYDLDEAAQLLTLRVGYGQVGATMKRQGHKLALKSGRGRARRAAREKTIVVVQDLSQQADYVPNMLLLDARSEVALPVLLGRQCLGVLVVLSDQVGYFTESTVDVLQTLLGRVVTTYQNALYFEQQKQAEVATRDSAEQIRAMFDAIMDVVLVSDMLGEITDMNAASLSLLGYASREELLAQNILALIAPEYRSEASTGWLQALETGSSGVRAVTFTRRDGSTFAGELTAALLRDADGNPTGFVNVGRDVTERG